MNGPHGMQRIRFYSPMYPVPALIARTEVVVGDHTFISVHSEGDWVQCLADAVIVATESKEQVEAAKAWLLTVTALKYDTEISDTEVVDGVVGYRK